MVHLNEISYSRDAVVAAVRDYYHFLATMYMDESEIIEPPKGGWPSITSNTWDDFDKTNEVVSLLRCLPYIRDGGPIAIDGAPGCKFADWQALAHDVDGDEVKIYTEIVNNKGTIPPTSWA